MEELSDRQNNLYFYTRLTAATVHYNAPHLCRSYMVDNKGEKMLGKTNGDLILSRNMQLAHAAALVGCSFLFNSGKVSTRKGACEQDSRICSIEVNRIFPRFFHNSAHQSHFLHA